jgi:predicted Ser/Thr protein kinase
MDAKREVHSIYELVSADPATNLAVLHPSIVMNSWARVVSWVHHITPVEIPDPVYGASTVRFFPVFSGGLDIAGGKMVVGQVHQIADLVSYFEAGARGDGAASKMPLFTGPAGTGKSEFLTIMRSLAAYLTSSVPDYYTYTYQWKNLGQITALKPYLTGAGIDLPRMDPLKTSPFALLPAEIQAKVLGLARDRAVKIAKVDPIPQGTLDPQSQRIYDAVLDHYLKGRAPSSREVLEILNKHVDIIRAPSGEASFVKLGAQGKDVPYGEIFFAENPFILTDFGPGEPLAYHLNGKVLQANGAFLLLDEWFRNTSELRDTFLDTIEDREVQRGGAPTVSLDAVVIGATNDESVEGAKSQGNAKAHLDRARVIPMRLAIHPWEIAKTMLLMKSEKTLLMRKLDSSSLEQAETGEAPSPMSWTPGKLNALYPMPMRGEGLVGPEKRFAVGLKMEANEPPIQVAPHTLEFMAYTIAATRLVTDVNLAKAQGQYGVANSPVFAETVTRLKVLTGELDVQPEERRELQELSLLLKEGSAGVSNRDAAHAWLTKAVEEARRPENNNTLTPIIALEVFDRLLQEGGITCPDGPTRLEWLRKIQTIANAFVVPWIESDLMEAMNSGRDSVNEIYDEIKYELLALSENRQATTYSMPHRKSRQINFARLEEVKKTYHALRGRALVEGELMSFHTRYGVAEGDKRHPGLLSAISQMLAQKNAQLVSWDSLASYGRSRRGDAEVAAKYAQLSRYMQRALGYNERALQMALEFRQQLEKRRGN